MRRLLVPILMLLAMPAVAEPPPSFVGELSVGVTVRAWLNESKSRGFLRVDDTTSQLYRMWKVALADLDRDGTREILLGVWSDVKRHREPQPHRTVWVVSWERERGTFVERWRGSALARPLRDFRVVDDQLVAHERVEATCFETIYAWSGFGFHGIKTTPIPCTE